MFIFLVGLWDFLGGTPETTVVLREERECGVQNGSGSAVFEVWAMVQQQHGTCRFFYIFFEELGF